MTSKNLCFKLMKEDMKRRIWNAAILFLAFLFCIVIPVVYVISTPKEIDYSMTLWLADVTDGVLELLGGTNPFITMIVVAGAVLCGVSGFSYLHTAKKVDFYHSIPVKREQLFLSVYFDGILMMAVLYFLSLVVAIVAASASGVGFSVMFVTAMKGYIFQMSFYCLIYTTVVLAMMLTGNRMIALLGVLVFFFYVPAVILLGTGYVQTWFQHFSYSTSLSDWLIIIMTYGSPFICFMQKLENYETLAMAATVSGTLLVTAVMAVGTCLLYRMRPSEAAGKAMAFKKSMMPIKILVVMPMTMAFCLFFYALRSTFAWGVFGVLFGALLTHCLMEIIYHFDFRKLFSHKLHLAVCMVAGILLLCGFKYDWFGYDSYLPKAQQVRSASIYLRSMDNWVSYGEVKLDERRDYYEWEYLDGTDYVQKHMEVKDPEDIIRMAEQGIRYGKEDEDNGFGTRYYDYYQNGTEKLTRYEIQYTLNSGRKVTRAYLAKMTDVEDSIKRIYDSASYKEGVYPILLQTPEDTVRVNFQQYDLVQRVPEHVDVEALLRVYQEELKALTYETRIRETPIGTIQFVTTDMDEALEAMMKEGSDGYYYARDIENRSYYPVYPSFTGTLEMLKSGGFTGNASIRAEDISMISIYDYTGNYDKFEASGNYNARDYEIVEEEEIETLAPLLIFEDYYDMNSLYDLGERDNLSIRVSMKDGRELSCLIGADQYPDFLKQKFDKRRKG